MSDALLVVQLLGPLYLAIAVGMFVSPDHYKKMYDEIMKNRPMLYFSGLLAFFVGFLILRSVGMWASGWMAIVSLIGWAAVLKGACLLIIPEQFLDWNKWVTKANGMMWVKLIVLFFALLVMYLGYVM
ncbi:MAG: hypothetical protein AB7J40_04700 [Candidatus Altimarinota bacterium]